MAYLEGKRAFITGGRRGIGRAIALAFAREGADIAICDLVVDDAAKDAVKAVEALGRRAIAVQADVALRPQVDRAVAEALAALGELDIVVNNAGIALSNTMMDIPEADWDAVIDVNLKGLFNVSQATTARMMERRTGRVINISSIAGRRGSIFGDVHYSSAKAGVIGFTKCMARVVAPYGITVNAIAPGIVSTDILSAEHEAASLPMIPLGRTGKPDDIANVALFFASPLSDYVTGTVLDVNGGSYM
jgi:3-oxoacyl-[acyl-carrier protein] reductase